jgi:hypothetical protein
MAFDDEAREALIRELGDRWTFATPNEVFAAGARWATRRMWQTIDADAGGRAVHAAWRDAMLLHGRAVPEERMTWETLDPVDRALDRQIHRTLTDAAIARAIGRRPGPLPAAVRPLIGGPAPEAE